MGKAKLSLIFVLIILLTLLGITLGLYSASDTQKHTEQPTEPLNLRQSFENEGYKNIGKVEENPCTTTEPACGYCSGIILDGYCYIKP